MRSSLLKSLHDTSDPQPKFGLSLKVDRQLYNVWLDIQNIFLSKYDIMFKDDAMVVQVSFSAKVEGWNVLLILYQLQNLLMQYQETLPMH